MWAADIVAADVQVGEIVEEKIYNTVQLVKADEEDGRY